MTISTEVRRAGPFTGTGLVATYAFAFKIFATSDVVATQTDLTGTETTLVLNTDYTVSMNADQDNDPGGDVVLSANLTTGYLLTITSDVPELQSVELTNLGGFYPTVLNPLFDKLVILCQQLSEKLGRQITLPVSSAYTDITIPDPQANYYLQWKEDLSGLKNVAVVSPGALSVSPYIETLLNDADAATARTTLEVPNAVETLTNKTLTSPVLNGSISGTGVSNDTTLAGDSATKIVTEHAVKAYVDNIKGTHAYVPTGNIVVATGANYFIGFTLELYDTVSSHDNAVNNSRFTIPSGYNYARFAASVAFDSNATGLRSLGIMKNRLTYEVLVAHAPPTGGAARLNVSTGWVSVTPGDYFEVACTQSSGGNLNIPAVALENPWFTMELR